MARPSIFRAALAAVSLCVAPSGTHPQSAPPALFDGKSLAGWTGDPKLWRVEGGELVGRVDKIMGAHAYLVSDRSVANFRLTVEAKIATKHNNSGILFRAQPSKGKGPSGFKGYQAEIGGRHGLYWCDLYEDQGRGWLERTGGGLKVNPDGWNVYEIVAVGERLMMALNGEFCFDRKDPAGARAGRLALELHDAGPMEVRFRSFKLEENPKPVLETVALDDRMQRSDQSRALTPQEAVNAMTMPEGFVASVVAAEPVVRQPVAFTFDGRGRIWIAEAHSYPRRRSDAEAQDRIIILEDRDGDGRFETHKTFVDNLNLVSGLQVGFGGVWVGAAPYLLFIPDRDGDDRPDGAPQVLLDGWGYDDTHETLNSFIWGPDGWLYGNQGIFVSSQVGKPGTPPQDRAHFNVATWRYHPVRHEFEVYAQGGSNQWGLDFDDSGQAFFAACRSRRGGGPVTHVVQGAYYWRQVGTHRYPHVYEPMMASIDHDHDWTGGGLEKYGGHSHVGTMVYLGDNWPDRYRNHLFMHNLHGGRINHEVPSRRGSGFLFRHAERDFWFANDPWFVGVALTYGPDGAVYMIDWYDQQHCHHSQVEKWDRSNGRVYRIAYGNPAPRRVDLDAAPDDELVRLQRHKNDWFVRTARRVLQERAAASRLSPGVVPALRAMLQNEPARNHKLRALWALHVVGGIDDRLGDRLLGYPDEMVRGWAVQLLGERRDLSPARIARFAAMARRDRSPLVRLYLASALQKIPPAARWPLIEALASRAEDAGDANLPHITWFGTEPLVAGDLDRAVRLASRARIPTLARFIYRRAAMEPGGVERVLGVMSRMRDEAQKKPVLEAIGQALEGRTGLALPAAWTKLGPPLLGSDDYDVRHAAELVAARLGDARVFPPMRQVLLDPDASPAHREHALDVVALDGAPESARALLAAVDDWGLRRRALRALGKFDNPEIARRLVEGLGRWEADARNVALETLASRPRSAVALLEAVAARRVPREVLRGPVARQIARLEDARATTLLAQVWGAIRRGPADKAAAVARYKALYARNPELMYDASSGRLVFQKACAACHQLFGEGGTLGPDLTGTNRNDLDYLLENIVDPNALIGKDFQMSVVEKRDGQVLTGLIHQETGTSVTVRNVGGDVTVDRKQVTRVERSDVSMMPEDLLAPLPEKDVQDLLRYLRSSRQVPLPTASR